MTRSPASTTSRSTNTTTMSNFRLDPGLLQQADPGAGDPFGNDLISRLANEIFAGTDQVPATPEAPVTPPTTVAGAPAHVPTTPKSPAAPASNGSRDVDLSGGFPSSHSPDAPPPVHPTVVGAEPERDVPGGSTPQGGHTPGSDASHEFGEPLFLLRNSAGTVRSPAMVTTSSSPALI